MNQKTIQTIENLIHSESIIELKNYIKINNIDFRSNIGNKKYPFLFIAFDTYNLEIVDLLLNHGADINVQNDIGLSIAHVCVDVDYHSDVYEDNKHPGLIFFTCDFKMTKFAISRGVNLKLVSIHDNREESAVDDAISCYYYELATLLRNNGCVPQYHVASGFRKG